jgi:hypothetical protein
VSEVCLDRPELVNRGGGYRQHRVGIEKNAAGIWNTKARGSQNPVIAPKKELKAPYLLDVRHKKRRPWTSLDDEVVEPG